MSERRTMFITFTGGEQEKYPFTHSEVRNGELHIWTAYQGLLGPDKYDEYYFPLASIRVRKVWDGAD